MNVCNVDYGDIVVWTECGIAVERIARDRVFYEEVAQKVKDVFVYGVLPEVVHKEAGSRQLWCCPSSLTN